MKFDVLIHEEVLRTIRIDVASREDVLVLKADELLKKPHTIMKLETAKREVVAIKQIKSERIVQAIRKASCILINEARVAGYSYSEGSLQLSYFDAVLGRYETRTFTDIALNDANIDEHKIRLTSEEGYKVIITILQACPV